MKNLDLSNVQPMCGDEEFVNPYSALKPYEGQMLKYREICDIVGEEYKSDRGGSALRNQTNRWNKYIDIEKQGRGQYFINRVYDTEAELGILKSYGKYTRYIEQYLMAKFYAIRLTEDSDHITLSNREISEETGMVNMKYFKGRYNPLPYVSHFDTGIQKTDMLNEDYERDFLLQQSNLFFSVSFRLISRIIYDSLRILEKKSLIIPNKTFRLYKNPNEENNWVTEVHDCNEDEVSRILQIQHDSIEEFNLLVPRDKYGQPRYYIKNVNSLHLLYRQQRQMYRDIEKSRLMTEFEDEGWDGYYLVWSINLAKYEAIEYEIKKTCDYYALNRNIQQKMMDSKNLDALTEGLKRQFVEEFIRK